MHSAMLNKHDLTHAARHMFYLAIIQFSLEYSSFVYVNDLRRLRTVAQRSVKRAPPKSVFCREIQKMLCSMRKQAVVQKEVF